MSSILMFAALAVVQGPAATDLSQPPQLRNPHAVITTQDYPTDALRLGEYGNVTIRLHVSSEGRVMSCDVTETSGSASLDKTTCSLFERQARFEPAKNAAGFPTEGEYRMAAGWGVDAHPPRTTIDVPLQVSAVPPDYRSPVKARLVFDATGHVTACEVTTTSGSGAADRAACAYTKEQLVIAAPKSGSVDIPPVAVRYLNASFSTQTVEPPAKR